MNQRELGACQISIADALTQAIMDVIEDAHRLVHAGGPIKTRRWRSSPVGRSRGCVSNLSRTSWWPTASMLQSKLADNRRAPAMIRNPSADEQRKALQTVSAVVEEIWGDLLILVEDDGENDDAHKAMRRGLLRIVDRSRSEVSWRSAM